MEQGFQLPQNTSGKTTEQQIQDEIAGDDVVLNFVLQGESKPFFQEVFKQGVTFEWVKHKVSLKVECKYQDLLLFFNGNRIPEPFSIVDMPQIKSNAVLEVQIAEGAEIGIDKLREQVLSEIQKDELADAK